MGKDATQTAKVLPNYNEKKAVNFNKRLKYSPELQTEVRNKIGVGTKVPLGSKVASKAVAEWQEGHGLTGDGLCGDGTIKEMGFLHMLNTAEEKSDVGEKVGNLKLKEDVVVYREESKRARTRNVVGNLNKGDIVSYYTVNGTILSNNRYYIQSSGRYGWVDKAKAEITNDAATTKEAIADVNTRTPNYKQFDSRWGNLYYGKDKTYSTYSEGGCGPTSMANVVAKMKNASVTPDVMGELSTSIGTRPKNSGTNGPTFFPAAAAKYGLSVTHYNKGSKGKTAKEGLEAMKGNSGKYAVVHVGSGKWSGGGHFMTIYGYDGTKVYIDDPNTWNEEDDAASFCEKEVSKGIWVFG